MSWNCIPYLSGFAPKSIPKQHNQHMCLFDIFAPLAGLVRSQNNVQDMGGKSPFYNAELHILKQVQIPATLNLGEWKICF